MSGSWIPTAQTVLTVTLGTTGVNHSSSPPSLLPVQQTIPPNANRVNVIAQNQSAATIQVILDHDLSGTNYTVFLLGPAGANMQGGEISLVGLGIRHIGQVRIAAPAGAQYAVGEW